jgi:PEP-CTERM motif
MFMRPVACLAASILAVAPCAVSATAVLSSGPASPLPSELGARARYGGSGFEAVMLDAGNQVVGTTLNPAGSPAWQLGQPHSFRLFWEWFSGTLTWQIDFDRNGSFGAGETASFTRTARAGTTFDYILLTADSRTAGANSNSIELNNFRINGTNLGSFTANSSSPNIGQWFEPATPGPRFRSIEILGEMVYRNTGGNGAFQNERPRMQLQFFGPEPVPEPASWALLVVGFGAIGITLRRRRCALG